MAEKEREREREREREKEREKESTLVYKCIFQDTHTPCITWR